MEEEIGIEYKPQMPQMRESQSPTDKRKEQAWLPLAPCFRLFVSDLDTYQMVHRPRHLYPLGLVDGYYQGSFK